MAKHDGFYGTKFFTCKMCENEKFLQEVEEINLKTKRDRQREINSKFENSMLSPRFKDKHFDNYLPKSDAQLKILRSCKNFVERYHENPKQTVGMIFCGNPGTGKNHLASAIIQEFIFRLDKTALMTTALKIVRAIKESWVEKEKESKVIQRFNSPDLLVIDEVGVQFGSLTEQLYLTEIINDRYEYLRPTIILTNLNVEELKLELGDRVIDRFKEGGNCLIFDWESFRGSQKTI